MKQYDFEFKAEEMPNSGMKSAGSNGTLEAADFSDASKQVLEIANLQFKGFKKLTITLEEK